MDIKQQLPWINNKELDKSSYIDMSEKLSKSKNLDEYISNMKSLMNKSTMNYFMIDLKPWIEKANKKKAYDLSLISPVSAIYKVLKNKPSTLRTDFKGNNFLYFLSTNSADKVNNNYFILNCDMVTNNTYIDYTKNIDSLQALYDKEINITKDINTEPVKMEKPVEINPLEIPNQNNIVNKQVELDNKKAELAKAIEDVAEKSDAKNEDEVLDQIDKDEEIAKLINDIEAEDPNAVNINKTRTKRMQQVKEKFEESEINGRSVKEMLNKEEADHLQTDPMEIDCINKKEWEDYKFSNFEKNYDLDADVLKAINKLSTLSYPIGIRKITKEDTSTVLDYVDTYSVETEDSFGKRATLKFDVPKFIDNRFLMLKGNKKVLAGQLVLLPCMKTDVDTVQIVTTYNKIFIRRNGQDAKSFNISDRILRTLAKIDEKKLGNIKLSKSDNSIVCNKYSLPIDYIDISGTYGVIETKDYKYIFNQDWFRANYKNIKNDDFPYAIQKSDNKVLMFDYSANIPFSYFLAQDLCKNSEEFETIFRSMKNASRVAYSDTSIMATKIPSIVVLGYIIGLEPALKKAKVDYQLIEKIDRNDDKELYDYIKFSDAIIRFKVTYDSSILMNGLKLCDTENYSFAEVNKRRIWLDFLDNFGGRLLADGLDNFNDLLIDPISEEVCLKYNIPTNLADLLIYANDLLGDNEYNKHTDITGNRYRTNEIVAAYTYKALSKAYEEYRRAIKRGKVMPISMKKSAVCDLIMQDSMISDLSIMNPLLEIESANTVAFKGLSGLNSDRAYGIDKRNFDETMTNKLSLSTGFSGNVGLTRQATIDMDIDGTRGYVKNKATPDDLSVSKTLCMTEAITPFGVERDDPFRTAMTYVQTSKHNMRTKAGFPLLCVNGAERAMAHLTSDTFSFKAKSKGKIAEVVPGSHIIVKYDDGTADYVSLEQETKKNSDGGFYVYVQLTPDVKKGDIVKPGQIIAHDKTCFSNQSGVSDELSYKLGVLAKVAIFPTDEGYEDSTCISNWMSEALTSDVVVMKDIALEKACNIFYMVKVGQEVQEGEPLVLFQNAFEQDDANALLKSVTDDELASDLGRITIKAKVTGVIQDIKIYRTRPIEEYSESIQKILKAYEKPIKEKKALLKQYGITDGDKYWADYALPNEGELKDIGDGILIKIYLKYEDKMSIGDKDVAQSACKGVVRYIFPEGKEPYSSYRPDESVHAFYSANSFLARMITSPLISGAINKTMIELYRHVADIMGFKPKTLEEMQLKND